MMPLDYLYRASQYVGSALMIGGGASGGGGGEILVGQGPQPIPMNGSNVAIIVGAILALTPTILSELEKRRQERRRDRDLEGRAATLAEAVKAADSERAMLRKQVDDLQAAGGLIPQNAAATASVKRDVRVVSAKLDDAVEQLVEAKVIARPVTATPDPIPRPQVLILEDSLPTATALARMLGGQGFDVETAARVADGLELLESMKFDAIVLDLMLPDGDGETLLRHIADHGIVTRVIVTTGTGDEERKSALAALGVDSILMKPYVFAKLVETIRAADAPAAGAVR